ncbi:MAG: GNAT family N-acetyltransferase, partial [Verrucomicrobia bacterium]|nr:GNAT family N-acetyltransferase [Verrucomicrobiota bacterium]
EYAISFARQKDFLRITLLTDRLNTEESVRFFERYSFQRSEMVPMRLWLGSAAEWRAARR